MGHTSAAFALDVYSHVLPDMQDDAVSESGGRTGAKQVPVYSFPPLLRDGPLQRDSMRLTDEFAISRNPVAQESLSPSNDLCFRARIDLPRAEIPVGIIYFIPTFPKAFRRRQVT